jgi:thiol-disulfide isomerase/thioredoxin
MKKVMLILYPALFSFAGMGQAGYEIRVDFKNSSDTTVYLAKYYFGQSYIIDSCKHVKNGKAVFKGKTALDKGVYIIANQRKERYIDFLVNEQQKITLTGEFPDLVTTLRSSDSKENDELFSYARYFTARNIEHYKSMNALAGKSKADSIRLGTEIINKTSADLKKFDDEFMKQHKGTFVYDFLNLKNEKYAENPPLASNGRPDSVYQYYYYKSHYFDGVNFKDERIIYTPFFKDRITKYFETTIVQDPDTVIQELDKILGWSEPGNLVYQTLIGHFTYKFETNKTLTFGKDGKTNTFEKVFVHLADNYITNGKASGVYTEETVEKIRKRVDVVRNLLPDAKVADLFMIDTISGRQVLNMGFDTAHTSGGASWLYARNANRIQPLYKSLYSVQAKYTVLVFWSVDCGHCQKEIPLLNEKLKTLKGKVDYKVYAVHTKEDQFDKWKKFIIENKLDFINVFEPVKINNLTDRFDINRTPVIYLLDKDKKIKAKDLGPEQLIEIIKDLESKNI